MVALALDTLRRAARAPGTWGVWLLGLFTGWGGFALAILALGDTRGQARAVAASTTATWSVLLALQALARVLEQDEESALADAVDASRPGPRGRLLARWAGAAVAGSLGAALLGLVFGLLAPLPLHEALSLYYTIFVLAPLAAGWGLLLARYGGARSVLAGGLLLWILGHLPWGTAALLPGAAGRAAAALLPGPDAAAPGLLPASLLACGGVLLLALAIEPRHAGSRRG